VGVGWVLQEMFSEANCGALKKMECPPLWAFHFSKCPPGLVEETNKMHYKVLSNYTKTIGIGLYECWVVLTFL